MNFAKIISDSAVSSVRVLMSLLRGLILIPIITKSIGADAYGAWTTLLAVTTFFVSLGGLHLKGALIRYGRQEEQPGQTFIDTMALTTVSAVGFSGFIMILYVVGVPILPQLPSQDALHLLAALVSLIFLGILSRTVYNYPRSEGNVKLFELTRAMQLAAESGGLLLVIWYTRNLIYALWTMAGIRLFMMGVLLTFYPPPRLCRPNVHHFRRYLGYSLPMVPAITASKLFDDADKYLLFFLLSPAAAGIYGVAYSVARFFQLLPNVLGPTLYPTVTQAWDEDATDDLRNLYRAIFKWYTAVAIPALIGLSYLAEPALLLISTTEIAQRGRILLPLLGLGFFIEGFDRLASYILNAAEETRKFAVISSLAAIVNVLLNLLLIPTVGIFGAVFATVLAQFLHFVYMWWQTRSHVRYELPLISIAKATSAGGLMLLVLMFFPLSLSWQNQLIVYPITGAVVYGLGFVGLRGVTPDELKDMYALFVE